MLHLPLQALIKKNPCSVTAEKAKSTTGLVWPGHVSGACLAAMLNNDVTNSEVNLKNPGNNKGNFLIDTSKIYVVKSCFGLKIFL